MMADLIPKPRLFTLGFHGEALHPGLQLLHGDERSAADLEHLEATELDLLVDSGSTQRRGLAEVCNGKGGFVEVCSHSLTSERTWDLPDSQSRSGRALSRLEALSQGTEVCFLLTYPTPKCTALGKSSTMQTAFPADIKSSEDGISSLDQFHILLLPYQTVLTMH